MSGSIWDNKVIDYLPTQVEKLVGRVMYKTTPSGLAIPRWNVGGKDQTRIYGEKGDLTTLALAPLLAHVNGSPENLKSLNTSVPGLDLTQGIVSQLSRKKRIKPEQVPAALTKLLQGIYAMRSITGIAPGQTAEDRPTEGMSVSRFLAHAAQVGAGGAVALSLPYALKRERQLRALDKPQPKPRPKPPESNQEKAANVNIMESLVNFAQRETPKMFYNANSKGQSTFHPVKSFSPYVLPSGALMLMLSYGLSKDQAIKAINWTSDKRMQKIEDKSRKELTRLMVADNQSKEASSSGYASPLTGATLAIWALLAPLFYRFGKGIGKDTTGAVQYEKFVNALDEVDRRQPHVMNFKPSTTGDIEIRPGQFFGQTSISLPVPNRDDKGKSSIAADKTVYIGA